MQIFKIVCIQLLLQNCRARVNVNAKSTAVDLLEYGTKFSTLPMTLPGTKFS
jgi:hypothetical protein